MHLIKCVSIARRRPSESEKCAENKSVISVMLATPPLDCLQATLCNGSSRAGPKFRIWFIFCFYVKWSVKFSKYVESPRVRERQRERGREISYLRNWRCHWMCHCRCHPPATSWTGAKCHGVSKLLKWFPNRIQDRQGRCDCNKAKPHLSPFKRRQIFLRLAYTERNYYDWKGAPRNCINETPISMCL